ncbi:MAG: cytidine deaminase [Rikenellaceae bacterium]
MRQEITLTYQKYNSLQELDNQDLELVDKALLSAQNAYAPYSNFRVGAAARLSNGEIICANNQECAAYPSGICAERNLLYYIGANFSEEKVKTVAIISPTSDDECYPCGACREVIADFQARQGSPIRIIMASPTSASIVSKAEDLLPLRFKLK